MSDQGVPEEPVADDELEEGSVEITVDYVETDVDGDGVPDVVGMVTTTAIDLDGDGVPDVVEVVEAIGVDADGDGEISEDEIEVTETLYVSDEVAAALEEEAGAEGDGDSA